MRVPFISYRAGWLAYVAALAVAGGLIATYLMVEVSSQPRFCGTCHIMQPYYESWQTSTHNEVPCVECHIPPGVAHEVRKKWEALSMVTSYFTGTYGTNPWTEIDDAACLRCHQRRLLGADEVFGDVIFRHGPHLTELRDGKRLRCTSCHSQIVQGKHITVTTSTCILCHFKGKRSEETSRCTLCHEVPDKVIKKDMVSFDHSDVKRFDMECAWCHSTASNSLGGQVLKERCFTCHNEPDRLDLYTDNQLMHQKHVSEHKVDCLHCHLEIEHGTRAHEAEREMAQTSCQSCHAASHSPQLSLYSGIGGKGVDPMPAAMYLAGITCQGCHFPLPGQDLSSAKATEVSCMSCHGPGYRKIFQSWKNGVETRRRALNQQLDSTSRLLSNHRSERWQDARYNFDLVQRGAGVHNVPFAFALLSKAHQQMNEARLSEGHSRLPLPWASSPTDSSCMKCHQGIETQTGQAFQVEFSHAVHLNRAKLDCETCHRPHEDRSEHEIFRFGRTGCTDCHHTDQKLDCTSCHSDLMDKTVPSFRGEFAHFLHVDMVGDCSDCHSIQKGQRIRLNREACGACH